MEVLRHREFRRFFFGQAVSLLGDGMTRVALAFAVIETGGSATEVGLVLAAFLAPFVGTLLVGGVVADRFSRRALMVAADLARFATQGAMAGLLIAGEADVWMLAVLAGLTGAAEGFFHPAATGLVPALVPPEDLQRANGLRGVAMAGGEVAGPVVAGVLVAAAGAGWALAADAATFAVSAAFLARLRLPPREPAAAQPFLRDLREGWQAFSSRTWVWTYVASAAAGNVLAGAWSVLGPIKAEEDLGGPAVWGSLVGAMGAGMLVGGVVAMRTSAQRPLVVSTIAVSLYTAPLPLAALDLPVPVIAVGSFAAGCGVMIGNTLWESTLQRHISSELLSRVSSYDWFGSMAFRPLGLAVWGPIAAGIGLEAALIAACALQVVTSLAVLSVQDIRQIGAFPDNAEHHDGFSTGEEHPMSRRYSARSSKARD